MGEVFVEGGSRRHAGLLELDDHPRQSINEADQVGPAGIERTGYAELADQQEVVPLRLRPIHHPQALKLLPAMLPVGDGHRDAVLKQPVNLAVGGLQAHGRAVTGQFVDSDLNRLVRQVRVEQGKRSAQALHQHHFALRLAA